MGRGSLRSILSHTATLLFGIFIALLIISTAQLNSVATRGGSLQNALVPQTEKRVQKEQRQRIDKLKAQISQQLQQNSSNIISAGGTIYSNQKENSATGFLFENKKIREYHGKLLTNADLIRHPKIELTTNRCKQWGVVTTIFNPTDAISRVASLPNWCLVIVADLKTPQNFMSMFKTLQGRHQYQASMERVTYLSVEEQRKWQTDVSGPVSDYLHSIPWNHFCRKNIGYLFAILHGANQIFDFDDDNYVLLGKNGVPMDLVKPSKVDVVMQGGKKMFNHHPVLGAPNSWPRGFPLDAVHDPTTQGKIVFEKYIDDVVGVVQYVVDSNPDVDAIHRLTKQMPEFLNNRDMTLLVPVHTYSPYNAQATLHTKNALWAMLLPGTVPGRVSDIWRSYFAQCIFADAGLRLVFSHPKVRQQRNEHNYLQDFNAEQDLYNKAGKLIEFLSDWDSENDNIPQRMEALWIDLYEYGYIGIEDIHAVQLWLSALSQLGYEYPPLKRRHRNIAVLGQFNYANKKSIDDVIFWSQKTRERFQHVIAAGPWSDNQLDVFRDNSITVKRGDSDAGYKSPMRNLKDVLLAYNKSTQIEGILYVHDDAILNETELSFGQYPFPTDKIIYNRCWGCKGSGMTPRPLATRNNPHGLAFRAFQDGHVESINKSLSFKDVSAFYSHYRETGGLEWAHFQASYCTGGILNLAKDPTSRKYAESDGSTIFTGFFQSDFFFVPTKLAAAFSEGAELLLKHGIFIECAFPKILDMLLQTAQGKARMVNLCTNFGEARGSSRMLHECTFADHEYFGVIHPIKISKGYKEFDESYDLVQRG